MEKSYFIKLAGVLYRVTELFPKNEPLRISLKAKSNQILSDLILVFGVNSAVLPAKERKSALARVIQNIEVIQGFFDLAKEQNWVNQDNLLILSAEYAKIAQKASQIRAQEKKQVKKQQDYVQPITLDILKPRQRQIVEILRKKGTAQVQDFMEIFPKVTRRTLRRDFEFLFKQGMVERIGSHGETMYKVRT